MARADQGYIKQKSKGIWKIKLAWKDGITGDYKQKWFTFRGERPEALEYFNDLKRQYLSGNSIKPTKTKLSDFLTRWLKEYATPNLTPKAYERYAGIVNGKLIPALGSVSLDTLKPEHIQRLYSALLNTGLAPRSVKYVHTVLHRALVSAFKWRLISYNPADSIELPKAHPAEMQTWNEIELQAFLTEAKKTPYYALFYTALFTGARRSELLALRWQDIDTILCTIQISRTMHMLKDNTYIYSNTKTVKSKRSISLTPSNALILEAYRKAREYEYKQIDTELKDSDLVFSTLGKPMRPNTVSRAFEIVAQKAGIKVIRFHDARHTHASLMLKQGVHPKVVQERLGHSSIAITLDIYSHVAPGLQEAAALKFDDIAGVKDNSSGTFVNSQK